MTITRNHIKKILLIRPPRYSWYYYTYSNNFILPLGLLCVGAAIKRDLPCYEVKIIDCLLLKIGLEQLKDIIEKEKPDLVGVGEGGFYQYQEAQVCKLVKEVDPAIITLAGGHFFSWMVDYSLDNYPIDFIVRFEGEETVVDLLRTLDSQGDLTRVKGIAYRDSLGIIKNPLRPLIKDLDTLPMPAFDLVPVDKYLFWKYCFGKSINLEHSRGCVDTCSFCSMWTFWGDHLKTDTGEREFEVSPRYRTKSVERALEEVDLVYNKYKRNFIFWTDATFSVDPEWTNEFSEKLIKKNYKDLHWFAYLRADFIVRDEKLGILEKMVRSGLIFSFIGVERESAEELKNLKKTGYSPEISREAFAILKEKYPQVIRYATYIVGMPYETKESLTALRKFAGSLNSDCDHFFQLLCFPGTYIDREPKTDFVPLEDSSLGSEFINNPISPKPALSSEELIRLRRELTSYSFIHRFSRFWDLFSPYQMKRRFLHIYFLTQIRIYILMIIDKRVRKYS